MTTKTCFRCKTEKPIDDFSIARATKDGWCTYCRECIKKNPRYPIKFYTQPARIHPDGLKKCCRCKQVLAIASFGTNVTTADMLQTACRECTRQYGKGKPKKRKGYGTPEYKAKVAEYDKKYTAANRKRRADYLREWLQNNPGKTIEYNNKRKALMQQAEGKFTPELEAEIFERDGHRCLCCGRTERLCADHILPLSKGGTHFKENLQTLCVPCNSSKGNKATDYRR